MEFPDKNDDEQAAEISIWVLPAVSSATGHTSAWNIRLSGQLWTAKKIYRIRGTCAESVW